MERIYSYTQKQIRSDPLIVQIYKEQWEKTKEMKQSSKLCDETRRKTKRGLRQLSSQWHAAEQQVKTELRK
jgi:hypothetical protein